MRCVLLSAMNLIEAIYNLFDKYQRIHHNFHAFCTATLTESYMAFFMWKVTLVAGNESGL